MSRSRLLVLPLLFAFGTASLGGCGRRGPLESPLGSTPPPPARTGTVDPTPAQDETRPSLARSTSPDDGINKEQLLAPATTVTVPKTPFILDPLL